MTIITNRTIEILERINETTNTISNISRLSLADSSRISNFWLISLETQIILICVSRYFNMSWKSGLCREQYLQGLESMDSILDSFLKNKLGFILQFRANFYYYKMVGIAIRNLNSYHTTTEYVFDHSLLYNIYISNLLPYWHLLLNNMSSTVYISTVFMLGTLVINFVKLKKINIPYNNAIFRAIIYSSLPTLVSGQLYSCVPVSISSKFLIGILCGIGIPLYVVLGAIFDGLSIKMQLRKIVKNNIFTRMLVGTLYSIQIGIGIFGTNGLYYALSRQKGLTLFTASTIIAVIAGSIWHMLRIPAVDMHYDMINSLFRSMVETVFFCAICVSTYVSWPYIKVNIGISNIDANLAVCAIIGLIGYIIFGLVVIMLDSTFFKPMRFRRILYGVFYAIWFTFVLFCSNAVVELFQLHLPLCDSYNYIIWILSSLSSGVTTIFSYPEFYPFNTYTSQYIPDNISLETGENDNNSMTEDVWDTWSNIRRFYYLMYLHLCIQCYCFCYGNAWYSLSQLF